MKPFLFISFFAFCLFMGFGKPACIARDQAKPRILISSDIGGSDDDDFQSAIHLFMYANEFDIEGLISSPYGKGRKEDFLAMINLYEKDLPRLKAHARGYPAAADLRRVCKQGSLPVAPFKGYAKPSEGSEWIIKCARKGDLRPLWVMVWGGLEDLAQALHDAPEIQKNIRVYWIGGPNKKWGVNAYSYIAENFPHLWFIEANATYRGLIIDNNASPAFRANTFFKNNIQGNGAMGKDFARYYQGRPKMGDSPSLAYLMKGNPDDPSGESWGGSFTPIARSSRTVFERQTTNADTVPAYGVIEWHFMAPGRPLSDTTICFSLKIEGQEFPGYYIGNGKYAVRYSPKAPGRLAYSLSSSIPELDGKTGEIIANIPWPGKAAKDDYQLGKNWFSDRTDPALFMANQQGAQTIAKYREAFLADWAIRWGWLKNLR